MFSDADLRLLREVIADRRTLPRNTLNRPQPPEYQPSEPSGYVALTPVGGIPGITQIVGTGSGTGPGTDLQPGHALCELYRLVREVGDAPSNPPYLDDTGLAALVYNLQAAKVPGNVFVPILQEKGGGWLLVPPPSSGGTPGPTGPAGPQGQQGPVGASGLTVPLMADDLDEMPFGVPGATGAAGPTGSTGATGPILPYWAEDLLDGAGPGGDSVAGPSTQNAGSQTILSGHPVSLLVPTSNQFLIWNSVTNQWEATTLTPALLPPNSAYPYWCSDFTLGEQSPAADTPIDGWVNLIANNTTFGVISDPGGHPGILRLSSTISGGTGEIHSSGNPGSVLLGNGEAVTEWIVRVPGTLSSGAQQYTIRVGFADKHDGVPSDGAWVEYNDTGTTPNWKYHTNKTAGALQTTDSGLAVVVSTWYKIRIDVAANGSSATFTINDANSATIGSNVPTAVAVGFGAGFQRNAGTQTRTFDYDKGMFYCLLTTPR